MSRSESSTELLQAQAQTWNHIFSFISSSAIRCAVQLGIPDVLYKHGEPMCLSDLSARLSVHPSKLSFLPTLMRFLVHSGFLNGTTYSSIQYADHDQHLSKYYSLTPASRLLVKDEPLNVRSLLFINNDPFLQKAWSELNTWFLNNDDCPTAFHTANNGKSFWDYLAEKPKQGDEFNEAMASESRLISGVLVTDGSHVFEGLASLVDVGGGTGTLATAIAKAFPNMKCTVFDQPHVVGGLKGSGNLEFVGGSMFDEIPQANAILLKIVLHNWSDEDCVKILKKCKESIPSKEKGGKVIIIDMVMEEEPKQNDEFVRAQHCLDLLMMVIYAAKERTKKEWEKLFIEAGFTEHKITPTLGFRSIIEIYP